MSDVAAGVLRAHLEQIVRGAIAAAAPGPLVTAALARHELSEHLHVLAAGKAALPMLRAALDVLGTRAAAALAVAPHTEVMDWSPHAAPRVLTADHPVPREASAAAAEAVCAFIEPLRESDALLVLLSGGASALLTRPLPGLTLTDLAQTTRLLLAAGADIHELNCVRKHLDAVKGGRLARLAAPAPVLCLALSDVIGDDPAVIASGPFSADPTTFADAREALRRRGAWDELPASVQGHLERAAAESVKPRDAALAGVRYEVVGSNRTALTAAAALAAGLGYQVELAAEPLRGEAREVGDRLGRRVAALPSRTALIAGGETTVTVRGGGSGGRNQELALAAALALAGREGSALAAAGTDGVDGTSPAAGGVVDGGTVKRLRALGIDPERALALNDSYPALAAAGDALITGPTGTNVMDVLVALRG